jgi:parallel beta-helix repeat protein
MNRCIVLLLLASTITPSSFAQTTKAEETNNKKAALVFVVDSPGSTDAYDHPDNDIDETMDGICEDSLGRCTFTAATQEAANMDASVTITFSSSMTISLPAGATVGTLNTGSAIRGGSNTIVMIGAPVGGPIDLIDNCEVSNISFDNIPITMENGNIIKGCTFTNSGFIPVAFLSADGKNNIIGGPNPSDRNVFTNSKAYAITLAHSNGDGFNQIIGNTIGGAGGNQGGIVLAGDAGEGKNVIKGNVISGNQTNGISIMSSDHNEIRDNKIGTNAAGTAAQGNWQNGILLLNSSNNIIEENVVSGNLQSGIVIGGDDERPIGSSSNLVRSNFIGVSKEMQAVPNGLVGIQFINNAKSNIIGSTLGTDLDTNVIAYNSKGSIATKQDPASDGGLPEKNIFRRNRMFSNGDPGIVLEAGSQGNITVATVDSIQRNVAGELIVWGKGKPNAIVDVYVAEPNTSQYGEGKQWLEKGPVDANGIFQVNIGSVNLECDYITILQTDENNNTSSNAFNFGLAPNMVLLTESCAPALFGGVAYANNKYSVHVDWKGMPKSGEIEFSLNGNTKPGTINGDLAEVEYNMSQTVVGMNTLSWTLKTCTNRPATGMTNYQFCGTPVPGWLDPVTAMCGSGHMKYKHTETFPDVPAIAAGLGIPPTMAFVGGLFLSFAGAPSFTAVLNIPGESEPIEADATFAIGEFRTSVSASGTANTSFNGCTDVDLTGTLTLSANVAKDYSYGISFGTIPCPGIPGLEQACQLANGLANSLRVGATLSGQITGTATLTKGIDITGGSGGASLSLRPFLDVYPFHASGTGTLAFAFTVPDFSITSVTPSLVLTISESITGSSKSWTFPNAIPFAEAEALNSKKSIAAPFPYIPAEIPAIAPDTMLAQGIPWNARPAFAAGPNGVKAFAWVTKRNSNGNSVNDIMLKYSDGSTWFPAVQLSNDDNVDRNPAVTVDGMGTIIVCWEKNSSIEAYPESLHYSSAVMKNFDLAYAVRTAAPGGPTASGMLGAPNVYDAAPHLVSGKNGMPVLAWQANNGESMFGTPAAPGRLVVARGWFSGKWNQFDTLAGAQFNMFQWDLGVQDDENMIIALAKDTQGDLATGNDWEIFTVRRTAGSWGTEQRLTTNTRMEFGVHAAFTHDAVPVVSWMRDTSVIGSVGAITAAQEIWIPNAGMGFFNSALAVGKDTMALFWNEGTSVVMSVSPVAVRSWSPPKFIHFTADVQRSVNAQFDPSGSLHIGFQQSPYAVQPGQFSDSGSLQLVSLTKLGTPLGMKETEPSVPAGFALFDAYPNPFNASSVIRFSLPKQGYTQLTVTNILGREVARLADGILSEGEHSYTFNADRLASGIYFYTLRSGSFVQTKKVMLVK